MLSAAWLALVAKPVTNLLTPVQAFFREPEASGKGSSASGVVARSVLIDMEPKARGARVWKPLGTVLC